MGHFPTARRFIDRQAEIKDVENLLERVAAANSVAVEGIVYFGPPGVGKSRLLQNIALRCRDRKLHSAAFDFQQHTINSQRLYLLHLFAQLAKRQKRKTLHETLKTATDEEVLPLFAKVTQQLLKDQPLILLLDSCEFCEPTLFDWIGQKFLMHLEKSLLGPIALFLACRGQQVVTSNWPVQYVRATTSRYVPAFDFASTQEHLITLDKAKNSRGGEKPLYDLSNGHPLSNEALVHFLQHLNIQAETISQNRQQLAQLLYNHILHEYLLPPIESWPRENFEMICVPRRFDAAILEKLDPQYPLPWYSARMQELQSVSVHLIHVDHGKPAYQLDATLRKLLYAALAILRSDKVLEINQRLRQIYEEELRQEASIDRPRADSLLEMFYHHIQIELISKQTANPSVVEWLKKQLQTYFNPNERDDVLQLKLLDDLLNQDQELVELIERPALDGLRTCITDFLTSSALRETLHLAIRHTPPAEYQVNWFFEKRPLSPAQTVHSEMKFSLEEWRSQPKKCGQVAAVMYLPSEAKELLANNRNFVVELTSNTMDIPFELMHDGHDFLCLTHPIGRHIETMRAGKTVTPLPQGTLQALVVGDPTDNLPAARLEAEAVTALLQTHHFNVKQLIGREQATLKNFISALILEKYHLIHFTGHAFFNPKHPSLSGLQFVKDQEEAIVTAGELKRYLDYPAFIFFSACEAASAKKETTSFNTQGSLIENLAVAALEGGACGCVGPMWKIEDAAAKEFALAFYKFLFLNKPSGEAVRLARQQICESSIDWAAWVLFGNPHMQPLGAAPK